MKADQFNNCSCLAPFRKTYLLNDNFWWSTGNCVHWLIPRYKWKAHYGDRLLILPSDAVGGSVSRYARRLLCFRGPVLLRSWHWLHPLTIGAALSSSPQFPIHHCLWSFLRAPEQLKSPRFYRLFVGEIWRYRFASILLSKWSRGYPPSQNSSGLTTAVECRAFLKCSQCSVGPWKLYRDNNRVEHFEWSWSRPLSSRISCAGCDFRISVTID